MKAPEHAGTSPAQWVGPDWAVCRCCGWPVHLDKAVVVRSTTKGLTRVEFEHYEGSCRDAVGPAGAGTSACRWDPDALCSGCGACGGKK